MHEIRAEIGERGNSCCSVALPFNFPAKRAATLCKPFLRCICCERLFDHSPHHRSGLISVPGNAKVHYNYANLQKDLGNLRLAETHYRTAIRYVLFCLTGVGERPVPSERSDSDTAFTRWTSHSLWPRHESSHNNLGTILSDTREAEMHFQEVIRINPFHAKAFFNLGNLFR